MRPSQAPSTTLRVVPLPASQSLCRGGLRPTDDPGLSREGRRELQTLLAKRGYDVGAPDGAIGTKTKEAIADFELPSIEIRRLCGAEIRCRSFRPFATSPHG